MLSIHHESDGLIEITITDTLESDDFKKLEDEADAIIQNQGSVCVLIDAS